MDTKSLFSALSFVAVFIYLYIGFYTFRQNTKSNIHRVFLLLCTSYSIWSFAYAFAYVTNDKYVFSFWNKISAAGWCSFSALTLYLVLLITENKFVKRKIIVILIFLPAVIFFYMSVFLFGEGMYTPTIITNFFYVGDFTYNFSFEIFSIVILLVWGYNSESKRIKRQAYILVLSSIIPFCLNLLTQSILPLIADVKVPLMGQLYALIMIIGTYIVITRYKFLIPKEKYVFEEIVNEMMDMVVLLNEKGDIIRVSRHTLNMLEYEESELLSKDINLIVDEGSRIDFNIDNMRQGDKKYNEINILKKNGERVPVSISCIPIFDKVIDEFLGAVLVIQDNSMLHELKMKNHELQEKAIRDGLTKLYNHQYSLELVKKELNKAKLSIMMLDIDYFKKINDTYGHQFGDYVLEIISDILVNNVKDEGHVGRFGGEEFIVILPDISAEKAYQIGENIRSNIGGYSFNKNVKITISVGITQHSNEDYLELIEKADELLYKAKRNGRNRIEYE